MERPSRHGVLRTKVKCMGGEENSLISTFKHFLRSMVREFEANKMTLISDSLALSQTPPEVVRRRRHHRHRRRRRHHHRRHRHRHRRRRRRHRRRHRHHHHYYHHHHHHHHHFFNNAVDKTQP